MDKVSFSWHVSLGNIVTLIGGAFTAATLIWQIATFTANINSKFEQISFLVQENKAEIVALQIDKVKENETIMKLQLKLAQINRYKNEE